MERMVGKHQILLREFSLLLCCIAFMESCNRNNFRMVAVLAFLRQSFDIEVLLKPKMQFSPDVVAGSVKGRWY